ncbi:MAG: MarR family transcriptional regulator [Firmicutes bacterium HGW-Firmicutes-9]|jgi:DNA-binding MarR family transcriptional regulator|nr:MAG: MarR family transcriptional regulator [Firmicutes bacterium HGW-Firmicutes-9]
MDYQALAREYMVILHKMRKRKSDKQINESMRGEQFVLSYISNQDGGVIPSDISAVMGISTARITAALNSLESKGLITRRIDESDRRKILVELTDEGRTKEAAHAKGIMRVLVRMLENLGEADAIEFLRILKKVAEHPPEEYFEDDMQ